MSELISSNWKKLTAICFGVGLLGMSVGSVAPMAFGGGIFGAPCDNFNGSLQHWDKIIFTSSATIKRPDTSLIPKNHIVDIKVLDDPQDVADLEQKVVDFLNEGGFTRTGGGPFGKAHITVNDVEYSIACVSNIIL